MLTKQQHALLVFVDNYMRENGGIAPSFDEMKDALDLKSKSGIHRMFLGLEERGFIRRLPNRARAVEVLKLPGDESYNVVQLKSKGRAVPVPTSTSVSIPVMGRIAAGVPISAIQIQGRFIDVPVHMIGQGEHFALEVKGDSMIEAGINDGDTVLVRRTDSADNGDIVVALVDNEEATLKRYRSRAGKVSLEAANPAYETRIFDEKRIKVQGKLSGLIRLY
jgi:repressor LexA